MNAVVLLLCMPLAGDATEVTVKIAHSGSLVAKPLPMIIARVALPAGLQPRLDKLRELKQVRTVNDVTICRASASSLLV